MSGDGVGCCGKLVSGVRSKVYGSLFHADNPVSTIHGFHALMKAVPRDSYILDVGCGDGVYYTSASVVEVISERNLKILSIDIDAGAVAVCQKRIAKANLGARVTARAIDMFKVRAHDDGTAFDVVLFMESFPVIDPGLFARMIRHSHDITSSEGEIVLYHNLIANDLYSPIGDTVKRNIAKFTLVDFGRLTSIAMQEEALRSWGVKQHRIEPLLSCKLEEMHPLSWLLSPLGRLCMGSEVVQYRVSFHNKHIAPESPCGANPQSSSAVL